MQVVRLQKYNLRFKQTRRICNNNKKKFSYFSMNHALMLFAVLPLSEGSTEHNKMELQIEA